ncbi:MAG: HU family DNA-binding protein [Planctomycetota bacterium]|nr:HU family DNA-binding protein [Planctomycetota bacterium]
MTKKTKKEIVKTISNEIGLTQLKTKEIVQKTFDAIVDILVQEGRIELRKFGVFQVKKRAARKARNPRTGEKVEVAEKFVVTFKPGKEMEERVKALEEKALKEKALEEMRAGDSEITATQANPPAAPDTPETVAPGQAPANHPAALSPESPSGTPAPGQPGSESTSDKPSFPQ